MFGDYIFTIRVPKEWHRKTKSEAALRGISLGRLIVEAVNEYLSNERREKAQNE